VYSSTAKLWAAYIFWFKQTQGLSLCESLSEENSSLEPPVYAPTCIDYQREILLLLLILGEYAPNGWSYKSIPPQLTLEYNRRSGRPGSNEFITWYLRKRALVRFQLFSSFIFVCDQLVGARAVVHDFHRFWKGSGFGSSRPDVSVIVGWRNHADPTSWLEGVTRQVAVKISNSLSACFYGLVSSI